MATSKMTSSYMCTSCSYQILTKSARFSTKPTTSIRSFSSTAKAQKVGPESPHFVEIPFPPQRTASYKPRVKGQLPKPKVMSRKHTMSEDGKLEQTSAEFLSKVTPAPSAATRQHIASLRKTQNKDVEDARIVWKSKMAESRRDNLRVGLKQLVDQQVATDNRRTAAAKRHQAEREIRLAAKAAPSILNTLPTITINPNKLHAEKRGRGDERRHLKASQAKYEKLQVRRFNQRFAALHDLYLHSSKFILTKAELNEAINKEFNKEDSMVEQQFPPDLWNMVGSARSGGPEQVADFGLVGEGPLTYVAAMLTGGKYRLDSDDQPAAGDIYKKMDLWSQSNTEDGASNFPPTGMPLSTGTTGNFSRYYSTQASSTSGKKSVE